ncbi:MAG: DEAD/DEAH box helicase [archaeon]
MGQAASGRNVFHLLPRVVQTAIAEIGIGSPTEIQNRAIPIILDGHDALLVAPTGTGKTEAALLPILSMFLCGERKDGISILYITPLRALNRDMMNRLTRLCAELKISVAVRHGDTPQRDRRRQAEHPPNLLITTPETLQAILPSRLIRESPVRWVVIDEIHQLVENKRGTQLTIGLERLSELTGQPFQRVGLSATVGDTRAVAKFLRGSSRRVKIVEAKQNKEMRYSIEFPFPEDEDQILAQTLYTAPEAAARIGRIKELIDIHRSTLIFVNSRQHAEMLGLRLGMLDKRIGVHHGSLSKEERAKIESELKAGRLSGIVCTSTLELGIDIGSVDLAIQYLSPRRVTSLIQRTGRSGHRLGLVSKGIVLCASADDLLETMAIVRRAQANVLEAASNPTNVLDVLCHQMVGLVMDWGKVTVKRAFSIVRRAAPYSRLAYSDFASILEYGKASGLVESDGEEIQRARRSRFYYYQNLSMIPDERRYSIIDVTSQKKVGILGEEFIVTKAKVGLHFICRGRVWEIIKMGEDENVYVIPAEDPTAAILGW